jgi:tripartite-type tricarboxylate transporter receptor subunit TctC
MITRRHFLAASAAGLSFAATGSAPKGFGQAQNFPTRPVTLIVGFAAGGATDITMRSLAEATQKHLGQRFVIENRAGATATLGITQMAATANPDGYTVASTVGSVFRRPFMTKTTFNPATDLTYIINVAGFLSGIVVRSNSPWNTFQEFLAAAKTNPGGMSYGTAGVGTLHHITMERIAKQQGVKFVHVPFKGGAEAVSALLGGHIDAVADTSGWSPQVNAGQFRLLVTLGASRTKNWPNVPTLKETGIDMVANTPAGISGPKGMDPKIVKILHDAFRKGMDEPSFSATMEKLDQEFAYMSSEDYLAFAMRQIAEEKRNVEELGLREE